MEPSKKYIIYLNILLLTGQIICAAVPATISATSSDDQTHLPATTASANKTSSIKLDVTTLPPLLEGAQNNTSISSIKNIDANDNVSDLVSQTDEGKQGTVEADASDELIQEQEDEIDDLQHGGTFETIPKTIDEDDLVILMQPIYNDEHAPTSETEWIEEDDESMEDLAAVPPFVQAMTDHSSAQVQQYIFQGHMGIIIAALLIIILAVSYAGFVFWRRFIEKRYGNREILVNEEDMIDPNDMKHFSL